MSEARLFEEDSANISVLTPESHVFHQVPRLDKKGSGVGCLINKSLLSKITTYKKFQVFRKYGTSNIK